MADANFTRGSRWPTSSLPGPPGPCSRTTRYKRSLPLHDAGPYTRLLMRQCLHLLHDLNDQVESSGRIAPYRGRIAAETLGEMAPRIRVLVEVLRACVEGDSRLSTGMTVKMLKICREKVVPLDPTSFFRHW